MSQWVVLLGCGAAVFSPLLVFPVRRSSLPWAVYLGCVALTAAVSLPFQWRKMFRPEQWGALWEADSPELKRWVRWRKVVAWATVAFVVASGFSIRTWQPHQINWQTIVSAPGYMLMMWSLMMGVYIDRRRPVRRVESPRAWMMEGMAPLRSERWGESGR
jgi:hypothetical protein